MKRITLILSMTMTLLVSSSCVSCTSCERTETPSSTESVQLPDSEQSSSSEKDVYSITYYAVENGKLAEINPLLFMKDGNYPTSYKAGEEVYISPLKNGLVDISPNEDREFQGWYADAACTVMYSGDTTTEHEYPNWWGEDETYTVTEHEYSGFRIKTEGNLVFYAKLACGYWIGPY